MEHLALDHHFLGATQQPVWIYFYYSQYVYIKELCLRNHDYYGRDHVMYLHNCILAHMNEAGGHPGAMDVNHVWDLSSKKRSVDWRQLEWKYSGYVL